MRGRTVTLGLLLAACHRAPPAGPVLVTFPGSALGAEGAVLQTQLDRFNREHPGIRVIQRSTPDAADQRHQLYVQWLNAQASEPDILQLDVIWTPEFAAAGWILPLDRFGPDTSEFFPATIAANRWGGRLFALPWFVDAGMLYWRTDLVRSPPRSFDELDRMAAAATAGGRGPPYGLVWSGARYEGLVTTFLEYLGGYGGRILDGGRVTLDSPAAVAALGRMYDEIYRERIVPEAVLTWHEEETRFAFQNGDAVFMRNWPYATTLIRDAAASRVAGRFAVAPMPADGGMPTATLGGAQLAINARSAHPDSAWAVVDYLTRPEQMLERARVTGQFPARAPLYQDSALARVLPVPAVEARRIIEHAVPRPVTPVYTELSDILQVHLHQALTRQRAPAQALAEAAKEMQALLNRVGLGAGAQQTNAR